MFLTIAKQWLTGSPHQQWSEEDLCQSIANDLKAFEKAGQLVAIGHAATEFGEVAGLKHTWVERGEREWTTELIAHKNAVEILVAVRLYCQLLVPSEKLPSARKPYAVRLVFDLLGGGLDGTLTVQDTPHRLAESQVDEASSLLLGSARSRLPVVYLSAPHWGMPILDADELAALLGGLAHVVVEPSKNFSFALERRMNGRNPYGGAVGIVWPNASGELIRVLPSRGDLPDAVEAAIVEHVRTALTRVRPTTETTWAYFSEVISRRRIDDLKSGGSNELQAYMEAFDADQELKNQRLAEAEREIARLKTELIKSGSLARPDSMMIAGSEQEYYPGEFRDVIAQVLEIARRGLSPESRRSHLVDDLRKANPPSGVGEEIADAIKQAFAASGDLNGDRRRLLEGLGFVISEEGKHFKGVYQGDGRYTFVISKSSSDHRAGKNLASTINKTLFK